MKKVYDIPLEHMRNTESNRRVYSTEEEAPAINTCGGGNREPKVAVTLLGGLGELKSNSGTQFYNQDRVYDAEGLSTAIPTSFNPYYGEKENNEVKKLTIRKLTEDECYRLMGFEQKDTNACREAGQSMAHIYHQAGDSIVTTVLASIFGELLGIDYRPIVEAYADKLHKEVAE